MQKVKQVVIKATKHTNVCKYGKYLNYVYTDRYKHKVKVEYFIIKTFLYTFDVRRILYDVII